MTRRPSAWESLACDRKLTDAQFRVLAYLGTKPDGWVIHPGEIAAAMGRSKSSVQRALAGLRDRGWITGGLAYPDGRPARIPNALRRAQVRVDAVGSQIRHPRER